MNCIRPEPAAARSTGPAATRWPPDAVAQLISLPLYHRPVRARCTPAACSGLHAGARPLHGFAAHGAAVATLVRARCPRRATRLAAVSCPDRVGTTRRVVDGRPGRERKRRATRDRGTTPSTPGRVAA